VELAEKFIWKGKSRAYQEAEVAFERFSLAGAYKLSVDIKSLQTREECLLLQNSSSGL
jgi:hypothetical protein